MFLKAGKTLNIVYFMGGLGNQMFQYGLYRMLELQGNSKIKADISWYSSGQKERKFELDEVFPNISLNIDDSNLSKKKREWYLKIRKNRDWVAFINYHIIRLCIYFTEKEDSIYDERVLSLKHAVIIGYWQTEKYIKNIRQELIRDFTFAYGETTLEKWRNMLLKDNKSVAIHIRRGDYLKNEEMFENLSESKYYYKAIDYINDKIEEPHFVFFSDDISWVKKNYYDKNAIYIDKKMFDNYEDWYDMCLISCCSNCIIANSSFSWWGAWLNVNKNKIIIAPKLWLKGKRTSDVWCENWILM